MIEHDYSSLCLLLFLFLDEVVRLLLFLLMHQERSRFIKREELFFNLIEHVKRNVLQFDKNFYLQGVGIPQGSIISSLLCSLYYGHLERSVLFPFLEKAHESATDGFSTRQSCQGISGSDAVTMLEMDDLPDPSFLLLRFIDDILFISTSKRQAASFFLRLKRGFRDYNCFMNEEKFCLNFDVGPHSESRIQSDRVYIDESGKSFLRWSGLLVNCTSLEVQADYTRLYFHRFLWVVIILEYCFYVKRFSYSSGMIIICENSISSKFVNHEGSISWLWIVHCICFVSTWMSNASYVIYIVQMQYLA